MVGEGTRGGRERRREGESKGTNRQWRKGGLREGGLMMGTSEEGTGRSMGGGRKEASGGGIARGKDGAREQGNETSREVSCVYSIFPPNPAMRSCHCYFVITNEK